MRNKKTVTKKVQNSYKIIHHFSSTPGNNVFCWRLAYVHSVGEKRKNFKSSKILQPKITTVDTRLHHFVVKNSFSLQYVVHQRKLFHNIDFFLHCHRLNS